MRSTCDGAIINCAAEDLLIMSRQKRIRMVGQNGKNLIIQRAAAPAPVVCTGREKTENFRLAPKHQILHGICPIKLFKLICLLG